jgi:NADP-dependent 3-hydroxy acid dehydrogenase YdfG
MDELGGKVAVVTGAASGIGLALAERFAAEGMLLVLADIEAEPLEAVAEALRGSGVAVVTKVTDVADGAQVEALAAAALDAFGTVHLVCNNAGVAAGGPIQGLSVADWQWVLGVNLWGVIHGMRVFLPILLEQDEGHIVNTASMAGLYAAPFLAPYTASKFAVVGISEGAWQELAMAGSNVGISVLCPAWVRTRIHEAARNRPGESAESSDTPDPSGASNGSDAPDAEPADAAAAVASVIEGLVLSGIPPEEVAAQVVDGVRARRLWILTHPDSIPTVSARVEAIVSGGSPPAWASG